MDVMAKEAEIAAGKGARLIDGRAVAEEITRNLRGETERLKAGTGIVPGLAVVLVGEDPASRVYVGAKGKRAEELGFHSVQHTLPAETSEAALLALIERLNRDPAIHGILVQLPLPGHIDKTKVIEAIRPEKDVDGFHPINVGRLASGMGNALVPCTPAGSVILVHKALGPDIAGLSAVIVGRSNIVGKPVAQLLLNENCTVTIAHSKTRDLPAVVAGRRHRGRRGRAPGVRARRLDQARGDGDRCRHQPHRRRRRKARARRASSATSPSTRRPRWPGRSRRCPAASGR